MDDRKRVLLYKDIEIQYVLGSNWVYIGNKVFDGIISAKRYITKQRGKS